MKPINYSLAVLLALSTTVSADNVSLDTISVTATKIQTATKDISQSIAVVDEKTIEDKNILNIQEAIENIPGVNAESSTNSPSPRLIIRGAGLKARYGVREVMVVKDGVPMTDPDSFTRFDFIDMQDVSSVEVQKGPGSVNAVNATGGVIQLVTKSVFDDDKDRVKLGMGNDGQRNVNLKYRQQLSDSDFSSVTFSHRAIDNAWRDNNDFDSTQLSIKYGHIFEDDSTFETEASYTISNMNIPASMTDTEFETFKSTGEQHNTSSQWQHSARDSKIFALNAKYEKDIGDAVLKPRVYFNTWEHFHPVTGMINDSSDNSVYGTDLELNYEHELFSNSDMLVTGVTLKTDITNDSKKYEYADYETLNKPYPPFAEYISKTLSNDKGALAQTEDSTTLLYGAYLMETIHPTDSFSIDASVRADKLSFDISGNEITAYDYGAANYVAGEGAYTLSKDYSLLSAKAGSVLKITDTTNIYASVATANQAPTTSEISSADDFNITLDKSKSINYEIGIKTRAEDLSFDLAVYQNDVKDEIIQIVDGDGNTVYDNAGETRKRGLEFNGVYRITDGMNFGANYAYSDFKFVNFEEQVGFGGGATWESRDGNYLPYIPKHQYSMFAALQMDNGLKARINAKTWGKYYMDNANTQMYEGYKFVTNMMLGYEKDGQSLQLNVTNMFNQYYAMQASKDANAKETYKAAAPRSAMLTYSYKF